MRCFEPRKATVQGTFSYEGYDYALDLCDQHATMFDRDMQAWMRLARQVGHCRPASQVPNVLVRFPVTDGGVINRDEDRTPIAATGEISSEAMSYTFTEHALERLEERKLTRAQVFSAISTKNKTTRPGTRFGTLVYLTDQIRVVVNPEEKCVLTVAFRDEKEELVAHG